MFPGNYARMLFDENRQHVIHLIQDEESKASLEKALIMFQLMRKDYRALKPNPDEVKITKRKVLSLLNFLMPIFHLLSGQTIFTNWWNTSRN